MEKKAKYKGYIAFDFDRVIATRETKLGLNKFGEPIHKIISIMNTLFTEGYFITIFTGRPVTKELEVWLSINDVPYHSLNSNKHNPKGASWKPYYNCFVDDSTVNPLNYNTEDDLYNEIKRTLKINRTFKKAKK